MNNILRDDLKYICEVVGSDLNILQGKTIGITGGAGFLGYYFLHLFSYLNQSVFDEKCKVICIDNFIRGVPAWLDELNADDHVIMVEDDIVTMDVSLSGPFDFLIHAASIASPIYYRRYPIETINANVAGLKNVLDYGKDTLETANPIQSLLYFSSSEIYGDPDPSQIPTQESYNGNVSCTGPRACYDESKRLGETLSVAYHNVHQLPIKIVRPFNNYGPGLSLEDGRVISDFCRNVLSGEDIVLLSDGRASRTFCYIADAIAGYIKVLLSDHDGEAFNIGADAPEISIGELAEFILRVAKERMGIDGIKVVRKVSEDRDYLTDNPSRRCPNLEKARKLVNYAPRIGLEEGLDRALSWYWSESINSKMTKASL